MFSENPKGKQQMPYSVTYTTPYNMGFNYVCSVYDCAPLSQPNVLCEVWSMNVVFFSASSFSTWRAYIGFHIDILFSFNTKLALRDDVYIRRALTVSCMFLTKTWNSLVKNLLGIFCWKYEHQDCVWCPENRLNGRCHSFHSFAKTDRTLFL